MAGVLLQCPEMAWNLVRGALGWAPLMKGVGEGGGEASRWSGQPRPCTWRVGRGGIWVKKSPERWAEVLVDQLKGLVFFPRAVGGN